MIDATVGCLGLKLVGFYRNIIMRFFYHLLVFIIVRDIFRHFFFIYHFNLLAVLLLLILFRFVVVIIIIQIVIVKVIEVCIVHVHVLIVVCTSSKGCLTEIVSDCLRFLPICLLCTATILFFSIFSSILL